MSGYDLKKAIEQSVGNFWNESYGQIYPMLKHLATEGLATASVKRREGKPERYVYALTKKGRKALQHWLKAPAGREVGRVEILLKLFFGRQVAVADNIRHVQRFQALQRQLLQKYDAIEERLRTEQARHPDLPYWLLTVSYGRHLCQARLHWCDETLSRLSDISGSTRAERGQRRREPHRRRAQNHKRSTQRKGGRK